jgi:hypothetical protein
MTSRTPRLTVVTGAVVLALASSSAVAVAASYERPADYGTAALSGRTVLPATTARAGSAPSGAFFSAGDRAAAARNGLVLPATGPAFAEQPVQGVSSVVPADVAGEWWALSDNGYGGRANSADYELAVYRLRPTFAGPAPTGGGVEVVGGFTLSDPDRHVPWQTACDPTSGTPLPPLAGNALPAAPPPVCEGGERVLTGFDFDPESFQVAADGTFWIGEEFGPFLLHTDARGRLLQPPVPVPGVRSPQNPLLDVAGGERPTLAGSRGFEGLAISPDRRALYGLLEGAVTGDNPSDLRIYRYDLRRGELRGYQTYRTEMPAALVNTAALALADGTPAYPGDVPPVGGGPAAIGEITMLDHRRAVVIERDGGGDAPVVPRLKKLFPVELDRRWDGGPAKKSPALVDLLAVPDPDGVGGDGPYFRFPFVTIESVHPVDDHTLLVVNDNNYPFSNGRAFSRTGSLTGLVPDDVELITVSVSGDLDVHRALLRAPRPR